MSDALLDSILSTLLPGDADWPSAGSLDLSAAVRADCEAAALAAILGALPPDFAAGDADARESALRAIEAAQPAAFERLVAAAYLAYYTEPRVRIVVERLTGYAARPPQPLGYALEPFDEALLATQKRRAPFWRRA
ncbi:MAG: hypothetical protein JNL66_05180 [Alphaproteobacteria bacterium]|nr:hypothetical protein [Alphaproteobacteria bacterium]